MTARPAEAPLHLHLDPVGGIAGDMFLSAVLDAWPEQEAPMIAGLRAAGLPERVRVAVMPAKDHALTGRGFAVTLDGPSAHSVPVVQLTGMIEASQLAPSVKTRALALFGLIAEAEAAVHGIAVEAVALHELGAWDSVADLVGAAFLIDALGPASWSVGPLPLGSGRVPTSHGMLPVPAPATVKLLAGMVVQDDGIAGERVTPTGAAILRHLSPASTPGPVPRRLERSGIGFGTRRLPGISNVLRLLAYRALASDSPAAAVAVIAFEVDDQTPEDLAQGLDHLRKVAGVLDVVQRTAFGKKGRMISEVRVLADPVRLDSIIDACFHETATIGLRWHLAQRAVLAREELEVATPEGPVQVKRVARPGGKLSVKAAADDLQGTPGGRWARERRRRIAEAAADDPNASAEDGG